MSVAAPMHVVMNTNVTPSSQTGVGQYIECVTAALQAWKSELRLSYLVDGDAPDLLRLPPGVKAGLPFRPDRSYQHIPYQPLILRQLRKLRADLYHVPNTNPLILRGCPTVINIHDLQEFAVAKYSPARTLFRRITNAVSARVADTVLTGSEFSRREIVERLRVPAAKVHAVLNGRDERFRKIEGCAREIVQPYIISVGLLQPGKNYGRLLEAFAQLKTRVQMLVIVGNQGWGFEALYLRARQPDLEGRVVFLQNVSNERLVRLYNHADLCVLPSIYEGFGFPALEAMACGTPVAVANNSSMPEVVGEAGELFDPYSVSAMAEVMERLLDQKAYRAALAERGLKRARQFSWAQTASQTMQVYTATAKREPRSR